MKFSPMEIKEAQKIIEDIYGEKDRERGVYADLVWLGEELGELFKAVRESKGIEEEVADVFAWLLSVANVLGIDVEEAFKMKYLTSQGPP
ncbi:MazG nucleotide pyrophosphohydrolase domain family [Aciduliprofundum boonei T469]|nr:MazG nucleotide pyrophosphohydrolase domain family [Aciduliprofundum boonei T469]